MKTSLMLAISFSLVLTACSGGNDSASQSTSSPSAEPTSVVQLPPSSSPTQSDGSDDSNASDNSDASDSPTPSSQDNAAQAAVDMPWIHAKPGARAYLTDDGGSATVATVCKTPLALQKTYQGDTPDSCVAHPHGALVTILGSQPDHAWGSTVIADVEIQGDGFSGWVPIMELEPIVPAGIHLRCTTVGNATPEIFPSQTSPLSAQIEIGSPASVQLIKQYAYTGDANWYVRVLSGKHAGEKGFMVAGCRVPGSKWDANTMPWNTDTGEPI